MLDVALVLLVLAYSAAGYRTGFVVTVMSLVGFVGGALLGLALVPRMLTAIGADGQPVLTHAILLVGGILLVAVLAQAVAGVLATRVSRWVRGHHVGRGIDGLLGAITAALVTLAMAWGVTAAIRPVLPQEWSRTAAGSRVLGGIDAMLPMTASDLVTRVRSSGPGGGFPQVFAGLAAEPIVPVLPPDPAVPKAAGLDRAKASVVRVVAQAPVCERLEKGSGWVAADGRVVTNAHVVAGSSSVTVSSGGSGRERAARVVYLDPDLDLAVLAVPGLPVAPLSMASDLGAGDSAVVVGFPLGGRYTVGTARVRQVLEASGNDIYGTGRVQRRVYSLYATVRPGNSGGPLLDGQGRVVGTVFARSLDDARTGYALTNGQTRAAVTAGVASMRPVATGACTAG